MKFDDPKVKSEMVAEKYRNEQNITRQIAIENSKGLAVALELYAGTGGLTSLYQKNFSTVITNDINKESIAQYKFSAKNFIKDILPTIEVKIDLIDFDCYGSPSYEIQDFFEVRKNGDCPIVVTLSDGLGLWMKRKRDDKSLRKRYLLPDNFQYDERYSWRQHKELIDEFMKQIALKYEMKVKKLVAIQTKFKNYVLASYLLENL